MVISLSDGFGGVVDGGADPLIGAAAADITAHGVVDVGVAGRLVRLEQRGGAHDLAALAVAALRHIDLDPRLLHGLADLVRLHRLDGGDFLADGSRIWCRSCSGYRAKPTGWASTDRRRPACLYH